MDPGPRPAGPHGPGTLNPGKRLGGPPVRPLVKADVVPAQPTVRRRTHRDTTRANPEPLAQYRAPVGTPRTPVDAYRALRRFGAALLESRTDHPGARQSIVAFGFREELVLRATHLERVDADGNRTVVAEDPWGALMTALDRPRDPSARPGFAGGWVGYLAHEASSFLLDTPTPEPAGPARPHLPLAVFRLYDAAWVLDHATGTAELRVTDLDGDKDAARRRLDQANDALSTTPSPAAPAPHAADRPLASMDADAFRRGVRRLRRLVRDGDCFQTNLTASFAYPWQEPPDADALLSLYDEYATANPGAWCGFFETDDATILSASPELLAHATRDRLRLRPIAGTRPRSLDATADAAYASELRSDAKERAEHAMLVDLARNDAARLCRPGTVQVPNFAGVERYRHVMHLGSEVEGALDGPPATRDLLAAVFPGGTVTGAPKRRAVVRIAELEDGPRGPYTGTLGYIGFDGHSQWNLLIRTLVATDTHLVAHAGCGIVEGSRADTELSELEDKARAQVDAALGRATPAPAAARCGHVEPGPAWQRPPRVGAHDDGHVLLVDFEDSFVENLADYVRTLGASARVWSVHDEVADAWDPAPTHLIFSPGPGAPADFPRWRDHLARADELGLPVLGVCLGHQALAQHAGATIARHAKTVHGKSSRIRLTPAGRGDVLLGVWRGRTAGRYHSLVARDVPDDVVPLATLDDGTLMAARYGDRPWWGLQFHPESLLTDDGLRLVDAFLEATPDA